MYIGVATVSPATATYQYADVTVGTNDHRYVTYTVKFGSTMNGVSCSEEIGQWDGRSAGRFDIHSCLGGDRQTFYFLPVGPRGYAFERSSDIGGHNGLLSAWGDTAP